MEGVTVNKLDEIALKLLHYFIVSEEYQPIILQGAKNEIWLENMNNEYKIVRIVTNYIHNNDQMDFDLFKTKQIIKRIKKKTFSLNMNTLSIFVNLGDNVNTSKFEDIENISCVGIEEIEDLGKFDVVKEYFPSITKKTKFKENGIELFEKLSKDINNKGEKEAKKNEEVFRFKKPKATTCLLLFNVLLFIITWLMSSSFVSINEYVLMDFGALTYYGTRAGEFYRILFSTFLHADILHITFNMYALYVLGPQLESFYGTKKFIFIYFVSAILGSLLALPFMDPNDLLVGASGAIFGLLGALLYFGYYYRTYLGNVIIRQVVPIIVINLFFGTLPFISNSAHIGGLIGGVLAARIVGVKNKSDNSETINGIIMLSIITIFLIYIGFIR